MKRLFSLLGRWFGRSEEDDPIVRYLEHVDVLEIHLKNVAVSLGRLKGNERHVRFELEAALTKVDVTAKRIELMSREDQEPKPRLAAMQHQNQEAALELGRRLENLEEQRKPIQKAYSELRGLVREALVQRDVLMARVDAAEARDAVFGDASGVETEKGISVVEEVLGHLKRLEAKAEASLELFALESMSCPVQQAATEDEDSPL